MPEVLIHQEQAITLITINRPERRNAVDAATAQALFDAFLAFEADPQASVAVLRGAGGNFCAGADLKALSEGTQAQATPPGGRQTLAPMGPSRLELSKPVIAAIEGYAVAGGMELALWADLRVMAQDATLGIFCRRFGVPLIDGGTIRLPRLIGQSRALDLILTGRAVDAEEALQMGLVNRVVAPGQACAEALKLAQTIAAFPQYCLRQDRQSLLGQWDLEMDQALMAETQGGQRVIDSGETLTGAIAFTAGKGRHGIQ